MVKHMTDIAHMISGRFFGIIQDKIIELRLFEFVTTKETENPKWIFRTLSIWRKPLRRGWPTAPVCAFFRISDERKAPWLSLGHES